MSPLPGFPGPGRHQSRWCLPLPGVIGIQQHAGYVSNFLRSLEVAQDAAAGGPKRCGAGPVPRSMNGSWVWHWPEMPDNADVWRYWFAQVFQKDRPASWYLILLPAGENKFFHFLFPEMERCRQHLYHQGIASCLPRQFPNWKCQNQFPGSP